MKRTLFERLGDFLFGSDCSNDRDSTNLEGQELKRDRRKESKEDIGIVIGLFLLYLVGIFYQYPGFFEQAFQKKSLSNEGFNKHVAIYELRQLESFYYANKFEINEYCSQRGSTFCEEVVSSENVMARDFIELRDSLYNEVETIITSLETTTDLSKRWNYLHQSEDFIFFKEKEYNRRVKMFIDANNLIRYLKDSQTTIQRKNGLSSVFKLTKDEFSILKNMILNHITYSPLEREQLDFIFRTLSNEKL